PTTKPAHRADPDGLYVSGQGNYGRFLRRELKQHLPGNRGLSIADANEAIDFLFRALKRYGIVEAVRSDPPCYQLNHAAQRWLAGDGTAGPIDETRLLSSGDIPPDVNQYFSACYQRFVDLKSLLEAREHTAQVSPEDREDRESRFREGDLPLLFCSPTMELGVDIAQLNVVNLRNVPPTPANYAQRSGRAGRGGQPALVYTYCAGRSPHDQYYFKEPARMVGGSVAP
ncbi:MAG: helicase-related protein, partial [Planctomycetaceae bacterium]